MARSELTRASGFYDSKREEIWFMYPGIGGGANSWAAVINASGGGFYPFTFKDIYPSAGAAIPIETALTIGDLGETPIGAMTVNIGDLASEQSLVVLGHYEGQSYTDTGDDDNGTSIDVEMETGFAQLPEDHDPRVFVDVQEVEHLFKQTTDSQTITVSVGPVDGGDDPSFSNSDSIDLSESAPFRTFHNETGKAAAMKMSASITEQIQWRGSTATYKVRGYR